MNHTLKKQQQKQKCATSTDLFTYLNLTFPPNWASLRLCTRIGIQEEKKLSKLKISRNVIL